MNELSDRDWELVNAYHDGELTQSEALAFEDRLNKEAALSSALESIRDVSRSLSALRPSTAESVSIPVPSTPVNDNRRSSGWWIGGAMAASLTVALFLGSWNFTPDTPYDIHQNLVEQAFSVNTSDLRLTTSGSSIGIPDLDDANLTPVAFKALKGESITHYAGRNGCRLTYLRGKETQDPGTVPDGSQAALWITPDGMKHVILATNMDVNRFEAIATYLKLVTRRQSNETIVTAMSDATAAATPCVG